MPSKTSKKPASFRSRKKVWRGCTEAGLAELAGEIAREIRPGDRVLLEGEMGAGKSTLARQILSALGVEQPPEGSPTFAIAHEYSGPRGEVVHIDLYRIRSEEEIEEAGVHEYLWTRDTVALIEWVSMWPEFQESLARPAGHRRNWLIEIEFAPENPLARDITLTTP